MKKVRAILALEQRRPLSRWIVAALSVAFGAPAFAAPAQPQMAHSSATTEWLLERGTEDGVDYIAVTATNSGTDIALQRVCTVDADAMITPYDEAGSATMVDDRVVVTTHVTGRPVRKDR